MASPTNNTFKSYCPRCNSDKRYHPSSVYSNRNFCDTCSVTTCLGCGTVDPGESKCGSCGKSSLIEGYNRQRIDWDDDYSVPVIYPPKKTKLVPPLWSGQDDSHIVDKKDKVDERKV